MSIRFIKVPPLDWTGVSKLRSRIEDLGVSNEGAVLYRPLRGWRRIFHALFDKDRLIMDDSAYGLIPAKKEIPVSYHSVREAAEAVIQGYVQYAAAPQIKVPVTQPPDHYKFHIFGHLNNKEVKFRVERGTSGSNCHEFLAFGVEGFARETSAALILSLGISSEHYDYWE